MWTRVLMGSILIALAAGVLVLDQRLHWGPGYPFLLLLFLVLGPLCCLETLQLLKPEQRPPAWLCITSVLALLLVNWPPHVLGRGWPWPDPWHGVLGTFAAIVLASFLVEMTSFREPGHGVERIALAIWIAAYLGLLPCFLAQLRWVPGREEAGVLALCLAIFVPKACDVGAYFTGRLFGRHRMTPVLSPKKTWEGLAGGLVLSTLTAVALNRQTNQPLLTLPVQPLSPWGLDEGTGADLVAIGFGLTVGLAGVLGDLAESLIKRDGRHKDAGQMVPGFGGVLDVLDSILFAAPVAYGWLRGWGG